MRRLVPQVFLEPGARVGVDDALRPLGQEERPPRRQLGIVELEEMVEVLAIVQDVDLDRILARPGAEIQVLADVALERLQAADGRGIVGHREVREDDERAGADLVPRRHQRLAAVEGGAAGPAQQQQQPGWPPAAGRAVASAVRASLRSHASSPVRKAAGRAAGSAIAWPASPARSTARTPSSRSAARGPRADTAGGTAARRSGSARDGVQADAQPRQVLDPPAPGQRVAQPHADQVDQAQPILVVDRVGPDQDVRRLQVAVRQRPVVQRSDQLRPARRSAGGSAPGGRRPAAPAGPR